MNKKKNNNKKKLEVICGPMFSGKTEELINRLKRCKIANQNVIVFKPIIDNRYKKKFITSHSYQKISSFSIKKSYDILKIYFLMKNKYISVIGIDEAQFFADSLINIVNLLLNFSYRIIIAGLDQDYLGNPFGIIPKFLSIADIITKQCAICIKCGSTATKSQRLITPKSILTTNQILIGTFKHYEARCENCHIKGLDYSSKK